MTAVKRMAVTRSHSIWSRCETGKLSVECKVTASERDTVQQVSSSINKPVYESEGWVICKCIYVYLS